MIFFMLFSILNMKFPGETGQNLQSESINKKIPHKKGGAGGMWVPPASYEKKSFY